jgi:TPR repeat protein
MFIAALLLAATAAAPCRTPTLGADLTNISDSLRRTRGIPDYVAGALVRQAWVGGPAGRGGIRTGDVIQAVGTKLVQNVCDVQAAIHLLGCEPVRLAVRRGPDTLTITIGLEDVSRFKRKTLDDQKACRNGDGVACTALARAHGDARDLLKLGCDLGDGEGCYLLALELGNTRYGAAAYREACDGGNALACTNLGWMYERGIGVPLDYEAAMRLYKKGCDGSACTGPNNTGCLNLGRLYRDGTGVPVDLPRAFRIFRELCARTPRPADEQDATNLARACSLAGTASLLAEGTPRNIPDAITLMEKGCNAGDNFGCYNLGIMYENGDGVTKDKRRADVYYRKACGRGDEEACGRLE